MISVVLICITNPQTIGLVREDFFNCQVFERCRVSVQGLRQCHLLHRVRPLSILGLSWLWTPSYPSEMTGPTRMPGQSPPRHEDPVVRPWQLSWTWPGWVWMTPFRLEPSSSSPSEKVLFLPVSSGSRAALISQQATYPWPEIQRMMMFSTAGNEGCFWENFQSPGIFW